MQKSVCEKRERPGSITHVKDVWWTQGGRGGWDRAQLLIYMYIHASVDLESKFLKLSGQAEEKRLES